MLLLSPVQDFPAYLFVGEYAYSLGREIPVCERDVSWATPSPDGKHAMLVINDQGGPALHLWTLADRSCKPVWKGTNERISAVYWGVGRALVATGSVNVPNIVVQIATNGTAKVVAQNSWPNFTWDGGQAIVTLNKQRLFQLVSPDGSLSRQIALPDGMYLAYEGDRIFAENDNDDRLELNVQTLEWMPAAPRVNPPRPPKSPQFPRLSESSLNLGISGKEELIRYTVLKGEGIDRLIVSYGVNRTTMLRNMQGIFLQRGGSVSFVPINKEPASEVRSKLAEEGKAQAIEGAKNMFLHFAAYARRHGGQMPDRGANLIDAFHESSHDNPVLDEFVYEFAGGIPQAPTRTVLGYIRTSTGRAELYADGRVVWVPGR